MSSKTTKPNGERFLDSALRPSGWTEYVGQENIKNNLKILLTAARERGQPPEHLLFYGPPGLGKTTLAHLIASELGAQMKITSGPAIEKVGDLASILTNLTPGDILFIDEVHRLNKLIEEVLLKLTVPVLLSESALVLLPSAPAIAVFKVPVPLTMLPPV